MTGIERDVIEAARLVGAARGIAPAALLAVAIVETNAVAAARVGGRAEPLIRFEGHYFDRRLDGAARARARAAGLADPKAGAVANPGSQAGRWRLLEAAAAIDREAAYASTSWGLGQVMGAHWSRLGFAGAAALAEHARAGAAGQFDLCARFLQAENLAARLAEADFAGFARAYNGPNYRINRYDEKIAAAFAAAARALAAEALPARGGALARGDRGQAVLDLQEDLAEAGFELGVDGVFGPGTAKALEAFQRRAGLAPTGVADAATLRALAAQGTSPACKPG